MFTAWSRRRGRARQAWPTASRTRRRGTRRAWNSASHGRPASTEQRRGAGYGVRVVTCAPTWAFAPRGERRYVVDMGRRRYCGGGAVRRQRLRPKRVHSARAARPEPSAVAATGQLRTRGGAVPRQTMSIRSRRPSVRPYSPLLPLCPSLRHHHPRGRCAVQREVSWTPSKARVFYQPAGQRDFPIPGRQARRRHEHPSPTRQEAAQEVD
jgi:hypothetical protein